MPPPPVSLAGESVRRPVYPTCAQRRERLLLGRRARRRTPEPIVGAIQGDRRDLDLRAVSQLAFHVGKPRLAWRVQIAVTIGMDHDIDEVGIVEGRRRSARTSRR